MEIALDQSLIPIDGGTPGSSREANVVRKRARIIRKRTFQTALRQPAKILYDEVLHAFINSCVPNWDGYGAQAVKLETLEAALEIAKYAPDFQDIPDVVVDADGDIAFEWDSGENSLTVAVNSEQDIAYAGLFGDDAHVHGMEKLTDVFPATVLGLVSRVFEQ